MTSRLDYGIKALTIIGASFGGIALLTNAYYASRTAKAANDNAKAANDNAVIARENLKLSEDKQITERFAKAIELLGNERLEVKLGGIYALEQIAQDSPDKYHWTIMEVLTAFVRENAPVKKIAEEDEGKIPKLRTDIQAALTVIGRRNCGKEKEYQRLDLNNIDMRGANLYKAHLEKAILFEANLQGANLTQANLQEADLTQANLQEAIFYQANLKEAILAKANLKEAILAKANLQGADLSEANLQGATLFKASLQGAILCRANLQGAMLWEANLQEASLSEAKLQGAQFSSAKNLTLEEVELAEGDENTILPNYITRPKHWTKSE
ncbi:pentapeptide repeat-containing protein [Cylindrospermum sp. FACHB-282]|uniref:pentapeptide repeat-containing protein n=1 Tax=Cylindrospermum sp. FACHB-282 TaxID=2692794 RepID=UPI001F5532CA|nr:pentapeptide repeat-containing protein [Cylindrospermum sp. FACHB-282]